MKEREKKKTKVKNDILKPSEFCKIVSIVMIGFLLLILFLVILSFFIPDDKKIWLFFDGFKAWVEKSLRYDGKYAPAKTVISAVGLGGYAISSISAFKEKRAHGILHSYVLRVFFPYSTWFYVLHILLVLLGLYTSEMALPLPIGFCLIGVAVCFLHSLTVMLGTEYSPRLNRFWIRRLKGRAIKDSYPDLLANDVAAHIDASYRTRSTRGNRLIYAGDQFDLGLLTNLVELDGLSKLHLQEFNNGTEIVLGRFKDNLRNAFIFSAPYFGEAQTEIRRVDKMVIAQILKCSAMWDSSAFFKGSTHTATALLSYVLSQNDLLSEMALLSGLLFCIRSLYLDDRMDNGWEKSCDCLDHWVNSYSLGEYESAYKLKEHISMLSLCLFCWEQQVLLDRTLENDAVNNISERISIFSGGRIDPTDLMNSSYINQFVTYGFLVCKMYDKKYRYSLTRRNMLGLISEVQKRVDDLLAKHYNR